MPADDEPDATSRSGPIVGSAVLALGTDPVDERSLAVWNTDVLGNPTGAWIAPLDEVLADGDAARRLLARVERRALTGYDPAGTEDVLAALTTAAGLASCARWWSTRLFSLPDALADAVSHRAEIERVVKRYRREHPGTTSLQWRRGAGITDPPPDLEDLRQLARIRVSGVSEVVREALTLTRAMRWTAALWAEAEQTKTRRSYVRQELGPPADLPPRWLDAARTAAGTRLPFPTA